MIAAMSSGFIRPDPAMPRPLPVDGRQSERALVIRRGVQRHLAARGFASLPEVTLASARRADLVAFDAAGEIWIIEIKSSAEDLRTDRKWPEYRAYCDRLFFATLAEVPWQIFPDDAGLLLADAYGAEMLRPAPAHAVAAARRKAMIIRLASLAAIRLHALADPDGVLGESA